MRKEKKVLKSENIVYFPGLQQRLLSMGIELLELKKYEEAANYLIQARELDKESPEIETALLIALHEMGNYSDAKMLCEDMLKKGIGDYFETIDVYLIVLIQLREYTKVMETINALIEEKEVPPHKLEHYEKLLHFSEKRSTSVLKEYVPKNENKLILTTTNTQEQILTVAGLMNVNIQPYLNELISFLGDPNQHPFVQTMILNIFKEHGIDKNISIEKFHYKKLLVPTQLYSLFETPFYMELHDYLQKNMEQKNPSLYEQIKTVMDKHFFLLYPFELEPHNITLWTASYHSMGLELYGEKINSEKICENYQIEATELKKCLGFLHELEEISLPIL